ncbi:unnamed protein product [Pleuronectes platessa]|uniref:Uncharacterized protein n=1 Tax=Pleuronectes platessa TaxID=8262 RepID=A0A9N7Z2Y7_PLEPL|nr:unnamed protein product [Pleuronectes platessa]
MRERNDPTIKETVLRTLRTSALYRKTQSSNGCQKFNSERQGVLRHLRRWDVRAYSACSRENCTRSKLSRLQQFFSSEAVPLSSSSTLPPAAYTPDANLLSPSHQAANLE